MSLSCWLLAAPRARQLPSLDPDALDQPASDFLLLALRRVRAGRPAPAQRAAPNAPAAAAPGAAAAGAAAAAHKRHSTWTPAPAVLGQQEAARAAAAGAAGAAVVAAGTGPRVGLLLKACAQDHERIEQQVRRGVLLH